MSKPYGPYGPSAKPRGCGRPVTGWTRVARAWSGMAGMAGMAGGMAGMPHMAMVPGSECGSFSRSFFVSNFGLEVWNGDLTFSRGCDSIF